MSGSGSNNPAAPRRRKLAVLVIDDDADIATLIGYAVREAGFQPVISFNMETAIENLAAAKYAAIITWGHL